MNSKKPTASTMAVLDEDVILEIVMRLPLKCAISCMVLNKSLFRLISERKKALVSSAYPDVEGSIFCRFNDNTFKRITPQNTEITIDMPKGHGAENPIILDSCNGVLLLNFKKQRRICVFNPITGGIMPMNTLINLNPSNVAIALAVDLDAQTTFQFKLVIAERLSHSDEEIVWKFSVLVPSGGVSWLVGSPVELICRGEPRNAIQYVYVHGCVYWAGIRNHSIIVFDVDKEKARRINWPRYPTEDIAFLFGSLDGSLLSVYTIRNQIEIHSYDQVKDGWHLKHKIRSATSDPAVFFCNGQRLLISECSVFEFGPTRGEVLFIYDNLRDAWMEISEEGFSFDIDNRSVFSFVPTLAKVSDKYLRYPDFELAEGFLGYLHDPEGDVTEDYLRELQFLMLRENRHGIWID